MTQLKRILVPTDFSDHSERAAAYAVELAKRYEAEIVHCVHVSDIPADLLATSSYYMTGPSEEFLEQIRDEGKKSLEAFVAKHLPGVPIEDGVPGRAGVRRDHPVRPRKPNRPHRHLDARPVGPQARPLRQRGREGGPQGPLPRPGRQTRRTRLRDAVATGNM